MEKYSGYLFKSVSKESEILRERFKEILEDLGFELIDEQKYLASIDQPSSTTDVYYNKDVTGEAKPGKPFVMARQELNKLMHKLGKELEKGFLGHLPLERKQIEKTRFMIRTPEGHKVSWERQPGRHDRYLSDLRGVVTYVSIMDE